MTSKFALVIANTEYQDASFAKLTAPGRDAEEFAEVLRDSELAAFDDVQILLNEGESRIRRSIARFFVNRQRDDLLLLYFSGHGVRNDQGQLFLAANDTEISILDASGIPADFVTHSMNNSRSQRQLLILDCCNSGAFAHGSKSAPAIGKSMGIATAFEGSGFGRVVLTATDATQYAWEGDKVIGNTQKSVFTHFLIEGLKGEADRDGDGRIHVDELYDYTYEQVVRRTPKQTPGKWSYKQQGDLVLRENLKPRDVEPAPLPPDLLELLSHPNSGVRKVGVQDLISLLEGKHQGLARAAEEKLREIAENDDSLTLRKTASEFLSMRGFAVEQATPPLLTTPAINSEPLATSVEGVNEDTPVEKAESVESRQHVSSEPERALDDQAKKEAEIAGKQSVVETLKKERRAAKKTAKPTSTSTPIKDSQQYVEVVREKMPRTLPWRKSSVPSVNSRFIGFLAGGVLVISLLVWTGSKLLQNSPTATPPPTFTSQPEQTNTPLPAQTVLSTASELGIGSTMVSEKDGMTLLYVPASEFTMGSDNDDPDEKPAHIVYLDAFWIDQTEVTNAKYALCVSAGQCEVPRDPDHFTNSDYGNHPVAYVNWHNASGYCAWAGRRLLTEAEWEKAARGPDGQIYPWGNEPPDSDLLNFNYEIGDTTEAGNYPNGVSPYGAMDMAGNVWEWVADWYDENYYATLGESPSNPQGPASGQYRVLRGGSWNFSDDSARSAFRNWLDPTDTSYYVVGFRCAMSATP